MGFFLRAHTIPPALKLEKGCRQLISSWKWSGEKVSFPVFFNHRFLRDSSLFLSTRMLSWMWVRVPLHQDFSATRPEHCAPHKRHDNKGLNTSEWGAPSGSVSGMGDFKAMLHVFVLQPDHSWFFGCLLTSGGSKGNNENFLKEERVTWTSGGKTPVFKSANAESSHSTRCPNRAWNRISYQDRHFLRSSQGRCDFVFDTKCKSTRLNNRNDAQYLLCFY